MGRPNMKQGRFSPDLQVTASSNKEVKIKQLSATESHKLLGCHKEPAGSQHTTEVRQFGLGMSAPRAMASAGGSNSIIFGRFVTKVGTRVIVQHPHLV